MNQMDMFNLINAINQLSRNTEKLVESQTLLANALIKINKTLEERR